MPYLVQGSAEQLAELFNSQWLITEDASGAAKIKADLPRTQFLGTQEQAKHHVTGWQESTHATTYSQGNMCAGNAFLFLGNLMFMQKEDEPPEEYQEQRVHQHFAYINSEQKLAGMMVFYRKDDPSQWFIAVSEDNELSPKERTLTLLASFDLNPYIKKPSHELTPSVVDRMNNKLLDQLKFPFLKRFLTTALQADNGVINPHFERMQFLLRFLSGHNKLQINDPVNLEQINPGALLADNRALDLLMQHKVHLSFSMLVECLSEASGLREEIDALKLTDNPKINACLLEMTVHFHEAQVLKEYRAVLQEQLFKKVRAGQFFDEQQIQVTPFIIKKKYTVELLQHILSKEAYYNAVAELITLGLTQDIPEFFANAEKLKELELIHSVKDKSVIQICLIFWVKGTLSTQEYTDLIQAAQRYPLLAETLIALDKTGEFSIESLKTCAFNPRKQLRHSVIHHFGSEFSMKQETLSSLDTRELERLSQALTILKSKVKVTQDLAELAARNNQQGYLLRLFLPSFARVTNKEHRDFLIDLLYEGVQKGPITLGKRVVDIKEEPLRIEALKLQERLLCARQVQNLEFPNEHISFAAADNEDANKWRYVILKVEAQCKAIHERLLRANKSEAQKIAWQGVDKKYRQALYQIAYQSIENPAFDFKTHLNKEQEKVLAIVDPKITSWIYNALVVIANIFITALTLALANEYKYRKTGNFWFFNQTTSGEEVRALGKDLTERFTQLASPSA